jgi:hypothetical protein
VKDLAHRILASVAHGDGRFYVAGALGVGLGLGMMTSAVVLTGRQAAFVTATPWRSSILIVGGQVVASFAGLIASVPVIRRRERAANVKANLCPVCGYDLRESPDRCPECGTIRDSSFQVEKSPEKL